MLWETILGGITGIIGTVLTSYINYKQKKLEYDHEAKMIELETKAMLAEAEANIKITKAQVEGAIELADASAYIESQKQGNKNLFDVKWIDRLFSVQGSVGRFFAIPAAVVIAICFGFVDWLKGFMRPGLTIYLVALTTYLTYVSYNILTKYGGTDITTEQAVTIWNDVVTIVIYLTVSCVTWWFGDRRTAKFLAQFGAKRKGIKLDS